jgi:hypothetical protein
MSKLFRRVIRISAEDSPNVRLALAQIAAGETPTDEVVTPGVITWGQYQQRRKTWDKIRQCIGLDGRFWEGGELLMFPPQWLNRAERLAIFLKGKYRIPRGMGIDPGEGGANTAFAIVDELGLVDLVSLRTPNTDDIITLTLDLIHKHNLDPTRVLFDRGGGGKQHADRLRSIGYNVKTIGFGEPPSVQLKRGKTFFSEKSDIQERRYAYFNRRAEMYGELRILLDPGGDDRDYDSESAWSEEAASRGRIVGDIRGFSLPHTFPKLREQLAPIPLMYKEGRLKMLPKHKDPGSPHSTERTLVDIIGYSPDEADALVLAIHAMQMANTQSVAGAI